MRPSNLPDYLALWRMAANPIEVARARWRRCGVRVRFRDGRRLDLRDGQSDHHVFHRIFLRDEYRLGADPAPLDTVIDLGANIGGFSCFVAPRARRVVAYEPEPTTYERLVHNTRDLKIVAAVQQAVGAERGVLELHHSSSPYSAGRSSLYADITSGDVLLDAVVRVSVVPLDAVFAEHAVERCDLLKIDVEGAEYEILHGASSETLARIDRIVGEYHDVRRADPRTRIDAFCAFLRERGFHVETRPAHRHPNTGLFFARRD